MTPFVPERVTGKCKSTPRFKSVQIILNFEKVINIIIRKNIAGFSSAALILEISLVVNNSGYVAIFRQSLSRTLHPREETGGNQ